MCRPKKPLRRGATSRDKIGVMTCPQTIHSCPAWVYKSKSNHKGKPSYAQRQCFDELGRWRPGSDTHGPRNDIDNFLHTFIRFGHATISGGWPNQRRPPRHKLFSLGQVTRIAGGLGDRARTWSSPSGKECLPAWPGARRSDSPNEWRMWSAKR